MIRYLTDISFTDFQNIVTKLMRIPAMKGTLSTHTPQQSQFERQP